MSVGLVLFLAAVAIIVVVALCALTVYLERNFPSEKYDERQKTARGNAYRISHWIGMTYYFGLLFYFVMHIGESEWVLEPFLLLAIGILIQLQTFHIYCLLTHSALPLGEKPLPTIISYSVLGGSYLLMSFAQYIPEDAAAAAGFDGARSFNLFRLLCALSFLFLAVLHLIAWLWKEKE